MTNPTTTPTAAPFVLDRRTVLHLADDLSLSAVTLDEDVWDRPDTAGELREGRIMSVFAYESTWTWWERHPVGVELVLVLSGAAVFHLRDGWGDRAVALAAGESVLVPAGVWHRAEVPRPTTMLFVTPTPARTEHRDA